MIAPEVALGKAWSDSETAKHELKQLKTVAETDGVPWGLTHSLFANIGGFVIRISNEKTKDRSALIRNGNQKYSEIPSAEPENAPGSVQIKEDNPEPMVKSEIDPEIARVEEATVTLDYSNPYHLNAFDIYRLRNAGLLASLPYVTFEEINDKSKRDSFARAVTMFQIAWTAIQVIARAVRHLPISQLEITVVAFSACAIITYGLNWKKPKGVDVPLTLLQYPKEIPKEVLKVLKGRPMYRAYFFANLEEVSNKILPRPEGSPISNDDTHGDGSGDVLGILTGTVLFGALHLAAWNFVFPTRAEQIIWWAISLFCTTLILIFFPVVLLVEIIKPGLDDLVFALMSISYILARLYMLIEIFCTLCALRVAEG